MLSRYADRLDKVDGLREIFDGVYLVPHLDKDLAAVGRREAMFLKENGGFREDDFAHEQSLVIRTQRGLVIFNSCCHAGADRVIADALATFPGEAIYALIGGFHLYNKTEEEVRAFASRLKNCGVEHLLTGHCTGEEAFRILREELGEKVQYFSVGFSMEL